MRGGPLNRFFGGVKESEARLARGLRLVAGGIAAIVALSLPSIQFAVGYRALEASLESEVGFSAQGISEIINNDPEMWQFEEHRLGAIVAHRLERREPEIRRVVNNRGHLVQQSADPLARPYMTRATDLFDSGTYIGRVEISRSLVPLLKDTSLFALLGLLLGVAVYSALMLLPMRALQRVMASLFQEKERAHVTLHAIGDAVISTDPDGKVLMMNAIAERLTGWPTDDAAGRNLREIMHAVDAHTGDPLPDPLGMFRERRDMDPVFRNALLTSRDGRILRIADSSAPIRGEEGALQGMVVVFRDITAQQRMEEELLKTQKLESVGTLAGGIAHDFNNILTAILGNISLAEAQVDPSAPAHERLEEAARACQRARDLTNQLLTFSRGGAPVRKTGSLGALVRDTVGFAMAGAKARCEIEVSADLWPADIDEGQISQVIHNLVINALQAMPDGGTIDIHAENIRVTSSDALPLLPGRYVKVSVRDEGEGILPEHLPNLFDPYFTTKREGSGLGLSVCFNVVKNHGGFITATSPPGEGATFVFYLPASAHAGAGEPARVVESPGGAGRVLAMDDDAVILEVVGEMLRHLHYEPAFAVDGAEAISMYREAQAAGKAFSAVIMDLTIPGGMGGREAVARLLEIDPGARVIVSSGYSNDPVMADFRAHGFCGVVAKPYLMATLAAALSGAIGDAPGGNAWET